MASWTPAPAIAWDLSRWKDLGQHPCGSRRCPHPQSCALRSQAGAAEAKEHHCRPCKPQSSHKQLFNFDFFQRPLFTLDVGKMSQMFSLVVFGGNSKMIVIGQYRSVWLYFEALIGRINLLSNPLLRPGCPWTSIFPSMDPFKSSLLEAHHEPSV